jgi:hypothetical protein
MVLVQSQRIKISTGDWGKQVDNCLTYEYMCYQIVKLAGSYIRSFIVTYCWLRGIEPLPYLPSDGVQPTTGFSPISRYPITTLVIPDPARVELATFFLKLLNSRFEMFGVI